MKLIDMTHWYKYFIWLLIPIVFGCGSNSSDNTQDDTENEYFQISDVGDINGDGIQDSVVLTRDVTDTSSTDEAGIQDDDDAPVFLFSLYLGKGNNQYEQIKHFVTPFLSTAEASISIPKTGRLVIDIEHFVYEYAFRNNELYLEKYEQLNEGEPYLCLDFTKNELKTELYLDSISHATVPIPEEKRPSITETIMEQSMTSMFFGKYLSYDYDFFESLTNSYNQELNTPRVIVTDNDTLLDMKVQRGDHIVIELYFMRKGLSQKVREAIERDFFKLATRYSYASNESSEEVEYTSIEDVFNKSKETWEDDHGGAGVEWFEIKPIYQNEHFVTYKLECYNNYRCSYIITYDKETADSFSWDMIRKDDELLALLKAYILESNPDINEERIKYSECPPFIENDSLGVTYQYYEITDARAEGRPDATIPLDEIEPFLTEEGRRFLRR